MQHILKKNEEINFTTKIFHFKEGKNDYKQKGGKGKS